MTLIVSKDGPYFSSGSISFSQLRSNFKETSSSAVSASELLRVTDLTNTNPIVPDATENENISTSLNLKLSQFRNSIKYYDLNQASGDTDLNLDIASSSLWNGNLGKNIVKRVNLAGTSGSSNENSAVSLVASAIYNAILNISGSILGKGGSANGGNGGDALFINTNNTGAVKIKTIGASSKVYGGGGGGGNSGNGGKGGDGYYTVTYSYETNVGWSGIKTYSYPPDGQGPNGVYYELCHDACRQAFGSQYYCKPQCYRIINEPPGNCGCECKSNEANQQGECFCCHRTDYGSYNVYTTGGAGGSGQSGGLGQGYGQTRTFGVNGSGGLAGGANAGTGGSSNRSGSGGNWGEDGEDGGNGVKGTNGNYTLAPDFGEINGPTYGTPKGIAGRAIGGSGYSIDPNSISSAFLGLR